MAQSESPIADTRGRFAQVVKSGRTLDDARWTNGRVLLSDKRLVLVGNDGKRTISLASVEDLGGRHDVNQVIASVSKYVTLQWDDNVLLVSTKDPMSFEADLFKALLDQELFLVRHPAVEGGVVQDTDWEKARIKIQEDAVSVATSSGEFVEIELDDIGAVDISERSVRDSRRSVIEVEHAIRGISLETHFVGTDRHAAFLEQMFRGGQQRSRAELDLSQDEKEVLMALYSGVSPFEIPDFTGQEIDDVEATFERLVELDVLDVVRTRLEVSLTTRGRNLASEAISDQ